MLEEIGITLQELKERRENEGRGTTEVREWSITKLEEREDREKRIEESKYNQTYKDHRIPKRP